MSRFLSILLVIAVLVLGWLFFFNRSDTHQALKEGTVSSSASPNYASWHDYKAPKGQFRALLPNLPQHAANTKIDEESQESRDYEMYLAEDDQGAAFSINTITFTDKPKEALNDAFLEKTINDMLSSSAAGSEKSIKLVPYKKGKAVVFSVENEKGFMVGKAFFVGKTLYVLTSINTQENKKPQDIEFFFNSFELNPNDQQEPSK